MIAEQFRRPTLVEVADPIQIRRAAWLPVIAIGITALAVCALNFGDWAVLTPDSLIYLGTARHLRETGNLPPTRLMHPPGFPILLAPLLAAGDLPFQPIRCLNALAFLATSILTYFLWLRRLGPRWAFIAGLLTALCPCLIGQTGTVLSEPVFISLTLAALLSADRWSSRPPRGFAEVMFAGLISATAALVRSMGVVLGPMLALSLLAQQPASRRLRWSRAACFSLAFASPLALWQLRQAGFPAAYGYANTWTAPRPSEATTARGLRLQVERFARLVPVRLCDIKRAILPQTLCWRAFQPPWDVPMTILVGGVCAGVLIVRAVQSGAWPERYAAFSLLVLCFWPWDEKERLVSPLLPIFIGCLLAAARSALKFAPKPWKTKAADSRAAWTAVAAVGLLLVELILQRPQITRLRDRCDRQLTTMQGMAANLAADLPPGRRLVCIMSHLGESRILAAGAAYLGRRPIAEFVDYQRAEDVRLPTGAALLVHENLSAAAGLAGLGHGDSIGGQFVLYGRAGYPE